MITIKNPKDIKVTGDYSLIKYGDEMIAIILCATERTERSVHSGGNNFAVYTTYTAKGYEAVDNLPPNIVFGSRYGKQLGVTICKLLPNRNSVWKVLEPIDKNLLTIEQFSSIKNPIKLKWEYDWCHYRTKEWGCRCNFLADNGSEQWPHAFSFFNLEMSDLIPSFQEQYKGDETVYHLITDNNNYLIHDEARDSYTWYNKKGKALKFSSKGEWEYLGEKLMRCGTRSASIAKKMETTVELDESIENTDTPTIRIRRPRPKRTL
ncbi:MULTISPECIES: hypothetical protein [Bacteroidales]|uniref:hypothetical protein n=1 Tax=Bacteroidales TaxID=171549 RepID=UPI00359F4D89